MTVTTTKLKDWSLAIDSMASPAQVVVMHRSVGIARMPYVVETRAVIAYLVQVGVPEATARALAVRFRTNFAAPKETPSSLELKSVVTGWVRPARASVSGPTAAVRRVVSSP